MPKTIWDRHVADYPCNPTWWRLLFWLLVFVVFLVAFVFACMIWRVHLHRRIAYIEPAKQSEIPPTVYKGNSDYIRNLLDEKGDAKEIPAETFNEIYTYFADRAEETPRVTVRYVTHRYNVKVRVRR